MSSSYESYQLFCACVHGIKCSIPKVEFKIVPGHVMRTKGGGCMTPLIHDLETGQVFSFRPYSL